MAWTVNIQSEWIQREKLVKDDVGFSPPSPHYKYQTSTDRRLFLFVYLCDQLLLYKPDSFLWFDLDKYSVFSMFLTVPYFSESVSRSCHIIILGCFVLFNSSHESWRHTMCVRGDARQRLLAALPPNSSSALFTSEIQGAHFGQHFGLSRASHSSVCLISTLQGGINIMRCIKHVNLSHKYTQT